MRFGVTFTGAVRIRDGTKDIEDRNIAVKVSKKVDTPGRIDAVMIQIVFHDDGLGIQTLWSWHSLCKSVLCGLNCALTTLDVLNVVRLSLQGCTDAR